MRRIEDLIQRYFENRVTEEEQSEIFQLIQSGMIEETVKNKIAQSLAERLRARELPDLEMHAKGEEIFQSILRKNASSDLGTANLHSETPHLQVLTSTYRIAVPLAAALAILVLAGLFAYPWKTPEPNKLVEESGVRNELIAVFNSGSAQQKVMLEDGSSVTLQPGSEVKYQQKFMNRREVYLSGDAFFEVVKDPSHPFYVHANEITTKVLGTSFRVKANQGEKEIVVAVITGKVSVFAKTTSDDALENVQEITLTPNQQAIYKRTEHVVLKKIVEEPQVITGETVLKDSYVNEPVVLILEALAKSYGVDIRFDKTALVDCTLTSDIIEGEGLYDQLEIVCNALGGTYKMANDASIVIEANGCRSTNVTPK